ncbi:MAG: hypothetical protein KKE80_13035 [Gammaproteobacteria bacterium]|nr:hypothetical protein [Gammaproteobacteria bacterium]
MDLIEPKQVKAPLPILKLLQDRLDQLPKESMGFLAILLATNQLLPSGLSETILNMIVTRYSFELGPVHEAFATAMILSGNATPVGVFLQQQNQALIAACHANKAALAALEFILHLPCLLVDAD